MTTTDESTKVCSLALELEQLEHVAQAAATLTGLVRDGRTSNEAEARRLPTLAGAIVNLLGSRLRDLRRVVRGQRDPGEFWNPTCDTVPVPDADDDPDVRFASWSDGERAERACADMARFKAGTQERRGTFHPRMRRAA
jgi:hypothetical protein